MMDWEAELEKIFDDPMFADVTAPKRAAKSSDRLIAGFQQIVEFVETHNRMPQQSGEREERSLYFQLQGILKDPKKMERCRTYDMVGILSEAEHKEVQMSEEEQLEDIFNDPIFADVSKESAALFDIPEYMQRRMEERREADYVAQRVKCEDFERYEAGFKDVLAGLKTGKYRLIKFKEAHVAQGRYFVEDGMLVYIAGLNQIKKNLRGRKDSRTRCIYNNGMESGIYMQTLCKNLYSNGYTVQEVVNVADDALEKMFSVNSADVESGMIYVLRSLSKNPEISSIKNLYKIGFTTVSLDARLANAKNEPTYLCADVEVVATWRVYNVKSSVFENLIHKLFGDVQLQIIVDGKQPKEWFVVPLQIIEQAVNYIVQGKPIVYDKDLEQLIDLSE